MDAQTRRTLIARYTDGYNTVIKALEGATEAELDARPGEGEWSAREVVHHLADSEMIGGIRIRRLLAEDAPVLEAYDENAYTRVLNYHRPIATSLDIVRAVRGGTAELLEYLTEEQWQRTGTHTESGLYSVETWLEIYAAHAHEHAEQIAKARASFRR